jgi:MraZ protein
MFVGSFVHALDEKNRIVLPAKFRSQLSSTVYLSLSLDHSISLYGEENFAKKVQEMDALDELDADSRVLKRAFFANTFEAVIDRQGRLMIPSQMLAKAGFGKNVTIVGTGSKIVLYSTETLDSELEDEMQNLSEIAQRVRDKNHGVQ